MDPMFLIVKIFLPNDQWTEITNLRNLDVKNASGIDAIPPKPMQLSTDFFSPSLTKAIYKRIIQNVFPENAKTASNLTRSKS